MAYLCWRRSNSQTLSVKGFSRFPSLVFCYSEICSLAFVIWTGILLSLALLPLRLCPFASVIWTCVWRLAVYVHTRVRERERERERERVCVCVLCLSGWVTFLFYGFSILDVLCEISPMWWQFQHINDESLHVIQVKVMKSNFCSIWPKVPSCSLKRRRFCSTMKWNSVGEKFECNFLCLRDWKASSSIDEECPVLWHMWNQSLWRWPL
jgi:hypothetical protein